MEKQKFEDSWRQAFEGSEVSPSGSVWTGVELELERSSGDKVKRKLLFFQLLAAASTVFAMGVSSIYFLTSTTQNSEVQAQYSDRGSNTLGSDARHRLSANRPRIGIENNNSQALNNIASSEEGVSDSDNSQGAYSTEGGPKIDEPNATNGNSFSAKFTSNTNESIFFPASNSDERLANRMRNNIANGDYSLPSITKFDDPTIIIRSDEADPGLLLLARLKDEERMLNKEKPKEKEKVWASVGFGAGSFNPQTNGVAPPTTGVRVLGFSPSKPVISNPTAGSSYTAGIGVAGKLLKRVIVQGGISYLNQNAQYTSSMIDGQNATLNELAGDSKETSLTSPYKVNSNLQYLSVPVQAGYVVLDRSFGIQLNGGVSTDLFLNNTLTPQDNPKIEASTNGPGSDSPYRSVNFSGLVSTEFSYKVGDHYRIAVNPGLRYPLNPIYKSDVNAQVSPMTYDVSLRFRYIFK